MLFVGSSRIKENFACFTFFSCIILHDINYLISCKKGKNDASQIVVEWETAL